MPTDSKKDAFICVKVLLAATLCVTLCAAVLFVFTGCSETEASTSAESSEGADMVIDANYIKEHEGEFTLVDVRTESEFAEGHIPGAINIPYSSSPCTAETLEEDVRILYGDQGLSANDPIVVYCQSGVRATAAAEVLEQAGYTNVKVYKGSWADWTSDENNPVSYD